MFLNNNDSSNVVSLKATGTGYIYVLSDQGTTMHWETVYTPNGSGTVLSSNNYLNNSTKNYYSFQHQGNCDDWGNISFTNKNNNTIESIVIVQNHNSQWMTKTRQLCQTTISKYVIHKVTTCKTL